MPDTILIVDDDTKLTDLLTAYFLKFEITALAASNPAKGLQLLRKNKPCLVVLDVMLPGRNGFEVCKEIRKESAVPVVMLSARGDVNDRIVGLELGADDYLPKPFEPRELVARVQSVLRRQLAGVSKPKMVLRSGDLEVDLDRREASLGSAVLGLTTMEFEILALFLRKPGRVLSRDTLMDELRGIDWQAYNRSIDVAISRLRQKLGDDPKKPRFLKTVWGSGYLFIGKVESDG